MNKTVWTFGLIAGGILSVMMLITLPFIEEIGDAGAWIGYTTMVAAFLLTYFGVRSYRDRVGGGAVGFGRALAVGVLITVVASCCYVATWEVIYFSGKTNFMEKYSTRIIEKERAKGATQAQIDAKTDEMKKFAELYKNPFINSAMTFMEPLPVGILMALVSAGVLRRKQAAS